MSSLGGFVGGGKGVDKLDVEGLDGAERAGMGLPVQVSKGEAGYQAGGEEFVDIVRVEVLDCRIEAALVLASVTMRRNGIDVEEAGENGYYLSLWTSKRAVPW